MKTNIAESSEEFSGHSRSMRLDTPWLAAEDLLGAGDVVVTIVKCWHHKGAKFDDGKKQDVYSLEFEGKEKQLVLNSINRKTLVQLFDANVQNWKGQPITLYVDPNVRAFGQTVCGIRIRPTKPAARVNAEADALSTFVEGIDRMMDVGAIKKLCTDYTKGINDIELVDQYVGAAESRIAEIEGTK